jgi:AAA15 family ATPase/GTPase
MLKKIHITDVLSCRNTEITFDDVTLLIGRNGAGKTNILKTIQECAKFATNTLWNGLSSQAVVGTKFKYEAEFLINNTLFSYSIDSDNIKPEKGWILSEHLSECGNPDKPIISRDNNTITLHDTHEAITLTVDKKASIIPAILALLPTEKIDPFIQITYDYLHGISYYPLDNLNNSDPNKHYINDVISVNFYQAWINNVEKINAEKINSNAIMKLLHLWHEDKGLLEELKAIMGKNGLNLISEITCHVIPTTKDEGFYVFTFFTPTNAEVAYHNLSFGTQRILAILLAILYDKNTTLLIEQPEDGIHSGLLKKFLPVCFEYAKAYNKQLIITTHSAEVINLVQPQQIRFVRMTENGTKVAALSSAQLALVADYIDNEGSLFEFIDGMEDESCMP